MPESGDDSRAFILEAARLLGIDLAVANPEAIARNFNNFRELARAVSDSGTPEPDDPAGTFVP